MGANLGITATIGDREFSRAEVQAWEAERISKVAKKLGVAPLRGDLEARRQALVERKLELGHEALEAKLARELRLSARSSRLLSALSRGRRRVCTIELSGPKGSAEAMPAFYRQAMETADEAALLVASADHFLLGQRADGVQQVIETPGGAPLASRIFLDESDTGSVATVADPAFPVQWVAVIDGQESPEYAQISNVTFSPDGKHCAYTGIDAARQAPAGVQSGAWPPSSQTAAAGSVSRCERCLWW